MTARGIRLRFDGFIAGLGTASGTRIVVGHWPRSPFGPFTDVMVERGDGHRILLAPTAQIADFVGATYTFDEVQIVEVTTVTGPDRWRVWAGPLDVRFTLGRRTALGLALKAIPGRLAAHPAWIAALDRPSAVILPGVRTRGSAGNGRREWYGARDLHPITAVHAAWLGHDLGALADVAPPVTFGFGSAPRRPALVRITTTIELPVRHAPTGSRT
ncbi:MAG: hypothetical protein ACT4P1_13740 [Sporichthyaceae bacterium]